MGEYQLLYAAFDMRRYCSNHRTGVSKLSLFKSFKDGLNEFVAEPDGSEEFMDEREEPMEKTQVQQSMPPHPQSAQTVISRGMTVNGALRGNGVVKVEGTIEGEVVLDGTLTVAASGMVKGPVTANVIRVFGKIAGNVTAKERLYLEKTGYLEGDIETAALVVEDGGQFNGHAVMAKKQDKTVQSQREQLPELQFGQNYTVGSQEKGVEESAVEPETEDYLEKTAEI